MRRVPAYILAGGASRRFGRDKARAIAHAKPLVFHVADALSQHATRVTVVASRSEEYADIGFRTLGDSGHGLGPLDGLRVALNDLGQTEQWLLLSACDWLGIRGSWIDALLRAATSAPVGMQAVAFRGERWNPLFALYSRCAAPLVRSLLTRGQYAMWQLLDVAQTLDLAEPDDWESLRNINRESDLVQDCS